MMNTINGYHLNNCSYNDHLRHVFIIITAIIFSGILIHGVSATPINGPAVISSPGTYELQNDVTNNPFNPNWIGINITHSKVELDGMGHTIDGKDPLGQFATVLGINAYNPTTSAEPNIFIKNITIKGCSSGIRFIKVKNGQIENSTFANNQYGIELADSSHLNRVFSNTIRDNTRGGIHINASNVNIIYNNYFNNTQNAVLDGPNFNFWNILRTPGTSIVGGPYLGGNYWANPSGDGFSQKCIDENKDCICDKQYDFSPNKWGDIDYLPLTKQKETIEITITGSIDKWNLNVGTSKDESSIHMNVKSPGDWHVKVIDNLDGGKPTGSAGKMVEHDGSKYVTDGRVLKSPVYIKSGKGSPQALSGTETTIQEGTSPGTDYDIGVQQTISYSDAVLQGSNQYRVVITFIGSLS
jgi:parallel beta-helix repeat protein